MIISAIDAIVCVSPPGEFLRPCLLADDQVDLGSKLRKGASDEILQELFCRALSMKKGEHGLNFHDADALKTKMVSIGG